MSVPGNETLCNAELIIIMTHLLGCKDIDVLAIAGGSELSDVCLIGARGRRELQRNIPHQYGTGGVNDVIL